MAASDIFDRLKQDHDKHRRLISAIDQTVGASDDRRRLFDEYHIDAIAHAATEELTLYHMMIGESELRVYAQHAAKDHHEIDSMFKELAEIDMASSGWLNKFRTLKDQYLDHLKEEEQTIFPDASKAIGKDQAVALRDAYNALKPEEVERAESGADDRINEKIG